MLISKNEVTLAGSGLGIPYLRKKKKHFKSEGKR